MVFTQAHGLGVLLHNEEGKEGGEEEEEGADEEKFDPESPMFMVIVVERERLSLSQSHPSAFANPEVLYLCNLVIF